MSGKSVPRVIGRSLLVIPLVCLAAPVARATSVAMPTPPIATAGAGFDLAQIELSQSESRERRKRARERKRAGRKSNEQPNGEPAKSGKSAKPAAKDADDTAPARHAVEPKQGDRARPEEVARPIPVPVGPVEPPVAELKDVWSDQEIIAALQACLKEIGPAVAEVEAAPPVRAGQCGAPAPVLVRRIGSAPGVEIRPPALVNCAMVGRLHQWIETVVQPAARDQLGATIAALTNLSGYDCRFRNNASAGKLSEHGYGNALDVGGFITADKRKVGVLSHWGPTARDLAARPAAEPASVKTDAPVARAPPPLTRAELKELEDAAEPVIEAKSKRIRKQTNRDKQALMRRAETGGLDEKPQRERKKRRDQARDGKRPEDEAATNQASGAREERTALPVPGSPAAPQSTAERAFLTRIHDGACGIFTTVLGPEANEAHRNHFHLDLAPRKRRAFCE